MDVNSIIDLITALWLGFIGACVGSFVNVVAYRMPRGESVIWTPSHCPKCDHPIRAYDNVPVLGWLWLRGKCRDCGASISPRYAIVEFVMGAMFFILAYVELFSGGANLLGGPLTEFTGAYENVWKPQWDLIGAFAYQSLLLSLLMAISLIALDGGQVPKKIFWFGISVGMLGATCGIHRSLGLDGYGFLDSGTWDSGVGNWVSQFLGGAFFGWLIGVSYSAAATRTYSTLDHSGPLTLASILVGAYCGYESLVYIFAAVVSLKILAGITIVFFRVQDRPQAIIGRIMPMLLLSVFALFLSWQALDREFPLYGERVTRQQVSPG
ncbi:MAG: prepilin peptidase [Planctomycetota bacterium]